MKRFAMDKLLEWKTSKHRKPMIINGARQVGKSWLMKAFGTEHYSNIAYIDFASAGNMAEIFAGNLDIPRIILALEAHTGERIIPGDTLIIFDEVQEVPRALTSLKYFCENAPEYHVMAAGSLMGVALHPGTSFPVGKVDRLNLYPMSFPEFLFALGEERLIKVLETGDSSLINIMRDALKERLRLYYYVGGMPEAVNALVYGDGVVRVRDIQNNIIEYYRQDFSKHAAPGLVPRLNQVWDSILPQLSKENRKFIFGQVREGARAKDYELAIQWLSDAGLIHKVTVVKKPEIPLAAYTELNIFKIYLNDVGLLSAMGGIELNMINSNSILSQFKGAMTEQYVHQQILSYIDMKPYYYSAENSRGEVDFLLQGSQSILPIEVKAEENLQSKSLRAYRDKYSPKLSIRLSMSDYREQDWLVNIPLYDLNRFEDTIRNRGL